MRTGLMSYSNIHSEIKAILKEAMDRKDYKKFMKILDSIVKEEKFNPDSINGILFKDVKEIIKTKEDLENILLSTKVIFETKEEVLEFFELLLKYGFRENAIDYFEELIFNINDLELIEGFNTLLKQ
jgi:regulator of sirC expression with transglutaminase-like and TPR domain